MLASQGRVWDRLSSPNPSAGKTLVSEIQGIAIGIPKCTVSRCCLLLDCILLPVGIALLFGLLTEVDSVSVAVLSVAVDSLAVFGATGTVPTSTMVCLFVLLELVPFLFRGETTFRAKNVRVGQCWSVYRRKRRKMN